MAARNVIDLRIPNMGLVSALNILRRDPQIHPVVPGAFGMQLFDKNTYLLARSIAPNSVHQRLILNFEHAKPCGEEIA